ncbi:MAG: hypothetical protein JWR18_2605 [Segetibacter sp.]|nr:hypothetical protein [Segetibacter sp.]
MNHVETRILIQELETDGHSPMKFICSDGSVYYVKYRSGKSFDKDEINCLVFEMVCTALLQRLQVPTPALALVTIADGSYAKGQLKANKRYTKPEVIALGSKEIARADLIKEIEMVKKRTEFNRFLNPEDLIRIAIFDLWVDNYDRHCDNYNLLTAMNEGRLQYIAIDHAFAFGGLKGMNIFNEKTDVNPRRKLIQSQYFKSVVKFIAQKEQLQIIKGFISLLKQLPINDLIDEVFSQIPEQWQISTLLRARIIGFLQSEHRLVSLQQIVSLNLIKTKRGKP